ncbi:MAG: PEGA domain-containing protein [Acidobacteriota bacterium]|nr:PEGA domain-containing protein [Acidobacteriota bacterium]
MTHFTVKSRCLGLFVVLCMLAGSEFAFGAKNQILGEIRLQATNKAAKSSGVWIDGQYLGYLQELRGSRKILLMPGKHEIAVRQAGYTEFRRSVVVEPGQTREIPVNMVKDPRGVYPSDPSELKLSVDPDRAAVFVDGRFVGHAGEFGHGMLLAPGTHQIKIGLPGYRTFAATVTLLSRQTTVLKTSLVRGDIEQADPLIRRTDHP